MGNVLRLAFVVVLLAACGTSSPNPADMSATVDMFSICGHPGDKGNSLGVGQYCTTLADCTGMASLCSTLGSTDSYFCTMTCTTGDDAGTPPTNCGENASCICGSSGKTSGCACFPNSCK